MVRGFSADDGIVWDILASWHSLSLVLKMYLDRSDRCYEGNACDFLSTSPMKMVIGNHVMQ